MIQSTKINVSASGDVTLANNPTLGGQSGRIRVVGLVLMANGTVNVTFYSGPSATGTALTGPMPLVAQAGFTLPIGPLGPDGYQGWCQTIAGQNLVLHLDASVQVSGVLLYVNTPA